MDVDLDLSKIEAAAQIVDPVFRNSPQLVSEQLCAALGRHVLVNFETVNPLGSFKGGGADFLVRSIPADATLVCASSGNFGVALAYAARARDISVHVYVSPDINPARLARMRSLDDPDQPARRVIDLGTARIHRRLLLGGLTSAYRVAA